MNFAGMYRPRRTIMHRLPAWAKIVVLVAWSVVSVIVSDPESAIGMTIASLLLLASVVPPWRPTVKFMFGIVLLAAAIGAYTAWRVSVDDAIDMAADLISLVAFSLAVTGSTPMGDMLDLAASAARPFRKIVPPAIPGLMFAIVVRVIPEVAKIMGESKQALRARGIEHSLTGTLTPTATRTVGFALQLGQALHARGISDDAVPPREGSLEPAGVDLKA